MHLWGTPYENGVAQGELLKDEIKEMLTAFYQYLEDEMVRGEQEGRAAAETAGAAQRPEIGQPAVRRCWDRDCRGREVAADESESSASCSRGKASTADTKRERALAQPHVFEAEHTLLLRKSPALRSRRRAHSAFKKELGLTFPAESTLCF